jgi:hypothetical protein
MHLSPHQLMDLFCECVPNVFLISLSLSLSLSQAERITLIDLCC